MRRLLVDGCAYLRLSGFDFPYVEFDSVSEFRREGLIAESWPGLIVGVGIPRPVLCWWCTAVTRYAAQYLCRRYGVSVMAAPSRTAQHTHLREVVDCLWGSLKG